MIRPTNILGDEIRVSDLRVHYIAPRSLLRRTAQRTAAVDGVSFSIPAGTTLGLVGESGSGKSTTGRALLGLAPRLSGEVNLFGHDLNGLLRTPPNLPRIGQMVFQDPYASLNPRMTVASALREVLNVHRLVARAEIPGRVAQLLGDVGLPLEIQAAYPAELSGGQRQRVVIARALAMQPRFIVLDEVVSALDVSVQGQIVNLLLDLQRLHGLTYLFISHNLSVVRHAANEIAVMYRGRIVEMAPTQRLFDAPCHPYTAALLAAVLEPHPATARQRIRGTPRPRSRGPAEPPGCSYRNACAFARDVCAAQPPPLRPVATGHSTACHLDVHCVKLEPEAAVETELTVSHSGG